MILQVLAVGDVVAESGLDFLSRNLRRVKQEHGVHFTVVNGENAARHRRAPARWRRCLTPGPTW